MPAGYVIAESILSGSSLEGQALTLTKIERLTVDNPTKDQPSVWTMIHFEFPEEEADAVAHALADVLDSPGWYTNFDTAEDTVVIFPERVFRYRRGDAAARAAAEAFAAAVGVPALQRDW